MLALTFLAAANAQSLAPLGKWVVEGRAKELDCVLSRDFGNPSHPTGLAIRPSITGRTSVVVSFETPKSQRFASTTGKVTLLPAALVSSGERGFKYVPEVGREAVEIALTPIEGQTLLVGLPDASAIDVAIGDRGFLLSTGTLHSAGVALATCRSELARTLGADLSAFVHAPAVRSVHWIEAEDYPNSERKSPPDGPTIALLTVGPDGKPTACRAAMSSGRTAWDDATCNALLCRADHGAGQSRQAPSSRYALIRVSWTTVNSRHIPVSEDDF